MITLWITAKEREAGVVNFNFALEMHHTHGLAFVEIDKRLILVWAIVFGQYSKYVHMP